MSEGWEKGRGCSRTGTGMSRGPRARSWKQVYGSGAKGIVRVPGRADKAAGAEEG